MQPNHEVFNQPEPLTGYNLFTSNQPLQAALRFNAPQLDTAELSKLGEQLGSEAMQTTHGWPTFTHPNCSPTTASAAAWTRWSFTPATTH
jgi:hypothetical protein